MDNYLQGCVKSHMGESPFLVMDMDHVCIYNFTSKIGLWQMKSDSLYIQKF